MPILAGLPIVGFPTADPSAFQDTRTLAFRSLDGRNLLPFTGKEFISLQGLEGLDLVEPEIIEGTVPGMDGTLVEDIKYPSRRIFVPLFLGSDSSHFDYLIKRGGLRKLLNPRGLDYRVGGSFDLVATSELGERYLRCFYAGGMAGSQSADSAGSSWESVGLNLLACQPYWRGEDWSTPTVRIAAGVEFFGTFPGQLSASTALADSMTLTVDGDVPSWPSVQLVGPADTATITADGLSISIPDGIASGEIATIHTDPRTRTVLFDGVKDWARIAPTDRYRPLLPGGQTISVALTGATSASSGRVFGQSLFESWC